MIHRPACALAISALLFLSACGSEPARETPPEPAAEPAGMAKGIDRSHAGQPMPTVELQDAQGEASSLAAAQGEPVLVNLWATWCAPCVKELPTLESLEERPGAPRVIAVSQDMAPRGSVDAFLSQQGLEELEVWHDPKMELSSALSAQILPTTILYDAQGREVWRFVGDLDWTGEEAAALLRDVR